MTEKMMAVRDMRRKEKFFIDDAYLNGYAKACGLIATGVYVALCRHANRSQTCFPSQELMAEELKISRRSVFKGLKILADWQIITIITRQKQRGGVFIENLYLLNDKAHWIPIPIEMGHPLPWERNAHGESGLECQKRREEC